MRNKIFISLVLFATIFTACAETEYSKPYSPLWKYRDFPMRKVANADFDPNNLAQLYANVKSDFMVQQGIISNSNYVYLLGNNVVHYSNGNTTTLYTFASMSDIKYLDANLKYIAFLSNSHLRVITTNGSNCLTTIVDPSNFIATLGKGNSDLLAYGERKIDTERDRHIGGHNILLYNIVLSNSSILSDCYDIIGFSRSNKYLVYTYYTSIWYMNNPEEYIPNQGILAFYDIDNAKNTIVGDYDYSLKVGYIKTGKSWSDATVGITKDLTKFYVYQTRTERYAIQGPFIDGREQSEIMGVWEIDISSLGLTE